MIQAWTIVSGGRLHIKSPQDLTYRLIRGKDPMDSILLKSQTERLLFENELKLSFVARGIFETSHPAYVIEYRTNVRLMPTHERQFEILVTINEQGADTPSWYMILLSPQWAISSKCLAELAGTIASYLPLSNTKWIHQEQPLRWN